MSSILHIIYYILHIIYYILVCASTKYLTEANPGRGGEFFQLIVLGAAHHGRENTAGKTRQQEFESVGHIASVVKKLMNMFS